MTGKTRFDENLDGATTICILAICLIWGVYGLSVRSHFQRWYFPQFQMASLNLILVLCIYASACAMGFLFPESSDLQIVMKTLCKAFIVSSQFRRVLLLFGLKHSVDIQVKRAATLLEGHPPVSSISWIPVITLGWIWFGRKIQVNLELLQHIVWREYFYTIGIVLLGYVISMLDTYGYYKTDGSTWEGADIYLMLAEGFLMIMGVSGVAMSDKILGKLVLPNKPWLYQINMVMFILLLAVIDFFQNFFGNLIDSDWWGEYGNFIMVLELLPFIATKHFLTVPKIQQTKGKEAYDKLESIEDFVKAGVVQSYRTWERKNFDSHSQLSLSNVIEMQSSNASTLDENMTQVQIAVDSVGPQQGMELPSN